MLDTLPDSQSAPRAKRGRDGGLPPIGKQVNVRLPQALLGDLDIIAQANNNDLSAVIRQVLSECVAPYVERARETIRRRQEARGGNGQPSG